MTVQSCTAQVPSSDLSSGLTGSGFRIESHLFVVKAQRVWLANMQRAKSHIESVWQGGRLASLSTFAKNQDLLGIVRRPVPEGSDAFFVRLLGEVKCFELEGAVRKHFAKDDVRFLVDALELSSELLSDPVYEEWLTDMAAVCKSFCDVLRTDKLSFWLGSDRGCRYFHVDAVPLRLLVTYSGKGTEWLPTFASDHEALARRDQASVMKDPSALRSLNRWDVGLFRGDPTGFAGIVHRTPPEAAADANSVLMRLDHPAFMQMFSDDSEDEASLIES